MTKKTYHPKKVKFLGLLILLTLLLGCETYHLTTLSLMEQMAGTKIEKKVMVLPVFPLVFRGISDGNSLVQLRVFDKTEKELIIPVTHRTQVRITKKDGKRSTFYFDTLIIQDSLITGKLGHFSTYKIIPINLNNISKIELQN